MKCYKCESENIPDATHCASCGEPLITKPDQLTSDDYMVDENTSAQDNKPVFLPKQDVPDIKTPGEERTEGYPNAVVTELSGEKKDGKKLRIAVTAVILVLAVVAGLGFMFRNKILKQINPERYLQVSLGRTFSDKKYSKLIDLGKYEKKPVKCDLSVDYEGTGGELSVMYDPSGEKALFEGTLDDGTTVYDDNLLYITRELIAISIPEVITEAKFLTIDPSTFADDLKEMGIEEMPPETFEKALNLFFGKTENGETDMDEVAEYYREAKFLEEYADFSQGETVSEKINGETYKLTEMRYEISEKDADQYLRDFLENYEKGFLDGMETAYQGYDLEAASQEQVEDAFDRFDGLHIKGDIVITYYIDSNDYVRKIVVDEFELTMDGEEENLGIEFEMLLGGKKNPTDDISVTLQFSASGEKVELGMNWEETFEDGVFEGKLEFVADADGNSDDMDVTLEIEWDTKDKKGENFKADLSLDGEYGVVMEVTGTLIDDKTSTAFTDGELSISEIDTKGVLIEFEFSISIIDPKDISIDLDDSMPLLDYYEQQSNATVETVSRSES